MTFRQMELFLAVCEYESMNRAANAQFISQQGISKMIRELEEELGCPLFIRSKNGVTPTKSGTYLLGECRAMLEKRNFIAENLNQMEDLPVEIIHLGMAFGMISAMPFGLIQDFEKSHPYVRIEYSDHTDYYLERLLKRGEYDFCITSGVLDGDLIEAEKLTHEGIYLCIPRTHRLYQQENIRMEDLRDEPFAMFSNQFRIRHKFVDSCERAGFEPNIVISSSDFNSLKELAVNNNLLFTVPAHTENPEDSKIRYYPFPDETFQWSVYFTKKKSKVMTDAMMDFYRHIRSYTENNEQ